MKFSIETTIAGAVAVAFAVLSMGVIAGERGSDPTSSTALRQVSAQGFNSSSSGSHGRSGENQLLVQY
jgi:hypothetical protein